ncbi:MAG TPA: HAMP domain-containing sensor histidine kinase [Gemmatimonadaceae bacterium]|nr:HAMP domain-containing sensor histidine kinase [Gemmatimonadaceae bacterium]
MTIRSKLALGLFSIAVILLVPLGFALRSLGRLHQITAELRNREFAASLLLNRMRSSTDEMRRLEVALLFVHRDSSLLNMQAQVASLAAMADSLADYDLASVSQNIGEAVDLVARYTPIEYAAAAALRAPVADSISSQQLIPAIGDAERALSAAEHALRLRTSDRVQAATEETIRARNAAGLSFAVAATFALIIAIALWRSISRPVRDLEAGMAAVADGNFGYRLSVSPARRDEFGRLASSFQTMAHQLAQLDRLRAEFISVASHELKTPINVILGYLQLVDEGVYGAVSTKQREILKTIDAQTQSLARLVHQLLDISRFEAGGGKLDIRATEFQRFLAELEDAFKVLSMQREIDFQVQRAGVLPAIVYWDADRINEVLGNLLSNAFKFTDRGGTIELHAVGSDEEVRLTVRDTGAGIPPQQLPHIFEKFYQADNQAAAAHGGTGLGLAIAREIVTAHRGDISVQSALGMGTTFCITLPVSAAARPAFRRRASSSLSVTA